MIFVYFALAVATTSLTVPLTHAPAFRLPPQHMAPVPLPELHLPEVQRLKIVLASPQKAFNTALPRFIDQPTPTLEMPLVPKPDPKKLSQPTGCRLRAMAPITID